MELCQSGVAEGDQITRVGYTQRQPYRIHWFLDLWKYTRARPAMLIGLFITIFYAAITILDYVYPQYIGVNNAGSILSFGNLTQTYRDTPIPPTLSEGWKYYLGTTSYGLPILPLMFASIATDIKYAVFVVALSASVGTFAGISSVSYGRRTDLLFMRFTDVFLSFPAIIMVIIYSSIRGWNYLDISIGILIIWWTTYARISRSVALPLKNEPFIEAGKAAGCSRMQLTVKHLLPNVMSFIFVQVTLDIGMVVSVFATVSYLFSTLNVTNAFIPEIGNMMVGFPEAGVLIFTTIFGSYTVNTTVWLVTGIWWPIVIPGSFLIIFILGVNLLGNGLRDYVNPKNRY